MWNKYLIICILLSVLKNNDLNAQISKDSLYVYWSESYKLQWTDFRCVLDSEDIEKLGSMFTSGAYIQAEEKLLFQNIGGCFEAKFTYLFSRKESWSREKNMQLETLSHEQLHFDIYELYARKIRKHCQELNKLCIKKQSDYELKLTLQYYIMECNKEQDKFDNETVHGLILKLEQAWEQKVAKELKETKEYEVDYVKYFGE